MWLVYVLALIVGGGLLLVQALSAAHDSVDHAPDAHHGAGPGLLSIRSAIYGVFAFGFVGATLHILGLTSPLAAGYTFATLGSPDASGAAHFLDARGKRARVLLPCTRERAGKIRLQIGGQQVDMKATSEGPPIPEGADVIVVDVLDDVARVAAAGTGGAQ
jgi:hypothetical protein